MENRSFFKKLSAIALTTAGINLREGKEALIAARLAKRLRALGIHSTGQYLRLLENDATGEELKHYIDSIATNFTSFFRERDHFDALQEFIAHRQRAGQTRFRFWSAACSSGEEPYSLAMTIHDAIGRDHNVDWKILATDISSKVLATAMAGQYEAKRLLEVPAALRRVYFQSVSTPGSRNDLFEVAPEIRAKVKFARLNLSKPPFPMRGPLDVVFCRNVMIYFTPEVRQNLVREIERLLGSGGVLFTGHSESLTALSTMLKPIRPSIYVKP